MNANYLNVWAVALKTAIDERNGENAAKGEKLEFAAKYTKTAILTEFDALSESDFCALYSGTTLQPSKVYRAIIARLEKAANKVTG